VRKRSSAGLIGSLCAAAGIAAAAGIHWHPEQLNVPAWVAYAACLAFVFAGLSVIAREFALGRLASWLVVAFMAAPVLTAVSRRRPFATHISPSDGVLSPAKDDRRV